MDFGNPPLRRSRDRRMIAGVMGGFAEHFDLNVTLLRVIYVIVSILSAAFPGILVYLLLWLLIPTRRPEDAGPARA
ncbi:MAG TPA: PspC domain-containing protein [Gemmatimonadota bacterium]|nr:PspC domain-containing protein [Gemmatimonadota bacterium]